MSIKQRGKSKIWWIDIQEPWEGGERIRRSTGTRNKKEAQEYHDQVKSELWRQYKLGEKIRRSWKEAASRWLKDKEHKKDIEKDKAKLRWLDQHLGDRMLDEIDDDLIDDIIESKREEPGRKGEGVCNQTINRYLALIRAILKRALDKWMWLVRMPVKIEELHENGERNRWITRKEACKLEVALPVYYARPMRFALATGLRQSNVLRLKWNQVDLERECAWIHARDAKAGEAIAVPLNEDALKVLQACKGQHDEYVFVKDGNPFFKIESAVWKKALKAAGITDFRWHDLRHTWASWHVMAGTTLLELMTLGGWKTYRMVQRYAHLSSEHLKGVADRISQLPSQVPDPSSGHLKLELVK